MNTTRRLTAAAAALALLVAACGDDLDDGATTQTDPEVAEDDAADDEADETEDAAADDDALDEDAADEAADEDMQAAGTASVAIDATELGDVLVDADGMTLYMFDADEQGGASVCYDDCEANWPPLLADGAPTAEAGADGDLLGTVERDDGTMQVTYDGWPLYYFVGDQAPGDVAGQAVQDVWWVIDASGQPLRGDAEAADTADDEDSSDVSY